MKLQEFGRIGNAVSDSWFQQILGWSRNKVGLEENLDIKIMRAYVGTSETEVQHTLGRIPRGIIPVSIYPLDGAAIKWSKEPTVDRLFIQQDNAGERYFILF